MPLSGTVVPMAVPTERGRREVDVDTLEQFTRLLVDSGVHGLFPGSSIGEFPSLTADQSETVLRTVTRVAADETTVLAGCCDTSVAGVRSRIRTAAEAGADAGVVVVPYYLETEQNGLDSFFRAVADDAELPLVLYNIPALTGNELGVETVVELADHDSIVGLKDTSGDLSYHHAVIEATPDSFAVFQGVTALGSTSLDLGADGLIAGPANVFPHAMTELYEAHANGDDETVRRISREVVLPIVTAYQDLPTAAAIKHLVKLDGLDIGDPLPPLAPLQSEGRERLRKRYGSITEALDWGLIEQ